MAARHWDHAAEEIAFAAMERAAVAGRRAPQNCIEGVRSYALTSLALAGKIKVEICGHNYRVVTILEGPHAGKSTAPDPAGGRLWKVIDTLGTQIIRADGTRRRYRDRDPIIPNSDALASPRKEASG